MTGMRREEDEFCGEMVPIGNGNIRPSAVPMLVSRGSEWLVASADGELYIVATPTKLAEGER